MRGAIAAFANVTLTFPLNKLISRQIYEGLSWRESLETIRRDGWKLLYRGAAPPLLQRGVSTALMFSLYDFCFYQLFLLRYGHEPTGPRRSATDVPSSEADWRIRAAAGVLAGSLEGLLTPFERVQTVLQHRHYHEVFKNTIEVTKSLSSHGITEYYRGFSAIILRNGPANALWFTLRDPIREALPPTPPWASTNGSAMPGTASFQQSQSRTTPTGNNATTTGLVGRPEHVGWNVFRNFVSGAVLGAGISTLFYPVNAIKSVMQLDIGTRHRGLLETGMAIIRERGVAGLYRGVHANMLRSLLSWGIINSTYELAKKYWPDSHDGEAR
jgi:hypothetical protein